MAERKSAQEYIKAWEEERQVCKEAFDIDIGEPEDWLCQKKSPSAEN